MKTEQLSALFTNKAFISHVKRSPFSSISMIYYIFICRDTSMCFVLFFYPAVWLSSSNPQIAPTQFPYIFVCLLFKAVHRIMPRHFAINRKGVPNISELLDCFAL